MTRVDFYVARDTSPAARLSIVCRLAEKAHSLGHTIHVHASNPKEAEQIDKLMWTFRDGAFLPHALSDDGLIETQNSLIPIIIGYEQEPRADTQILINLNQQVPAFFSRMDRVIEIVGGDENTRKSARERFKFYRDRGYDLSTHNV